MCVISIKYISRSNKDHLFPHSPTSLASPWSGIKLADCTYHNRNEILNFSHILWSTGCHHQSIWFSTCWPLLCIQCYCHITMEMKYLTLCYHQPIWFSTHIPCTLHTYLLIWGSDEIIKDKHKWTSFKKMCTNNSSEFKLLFFFKPPEFPEEGPKIDRA
jgi:hypothetical protein